MKKKKVRLGQSSFTSYQMMGPWLILFVTFMFIPVAAAIVLSFTSFDMLNMPKPNWFENYIRLFLDDDIFLTACQNTFVFAAITGPVSYLMSLFIAWFINELTPKIRAVVTLIFYAPSIAGSVYLIWSVLFSSDSYGYVNAWLIELGFITGPILWFKDAKYVMGLCIVVALWLTESETDGRSFGS